MLYSWIYPKLQPSTCPILSSALQRENKFFKILGVFENSLEQKNRAHLFLSNVTDVCVFSPACVFFVVKGTSPSLRKGWICTTGSTAPCWPAVSTANRSDWNSQSCWDMDCCYSGLDMQDIYHCKIFNTWAGEFWTHLCDFGKEHQ